MNNKSLFLVLMICGLILSALIARDGRLLLLAMPFLVYLMIGVLQAPGEIALVAQRMVDKPSVPAQEPIEIRIVIKNEGNSLINLCLDDSLFPSMAILDGQAQQRLSLSAGETTELNYVFNAARGLYSWNAIHASASDSFGLFELERDIPAFAEILVRPVPMRLRHVSFRPRSTLHAAGPISARLAGSGTDFFGIREYRTGDSLRRLNWRLAARHPRKLFTNEYEREEIADFGLILDARKLTDTDKMEEALFENSICAAAALSETFLKAGNRVALLIFGETITSLFPGYGKKQLNLILRNLASATQGSNLSFRYLEYFPARMFPSRSIIVMFSALDSRDSETYARLRSFGYDVLLISPDPVDYVSRMLPQTEINALAVRAARVERIVHLKRLTKMGVQVIDWQVNQPLEAIINATTRNLAHRRNI
jgi:uncharacterized protein (DUF58 family)